MTLIFGILLALACALATNVGFLYKHRGACAAAPVDMRHPLRSGRSLFASPMFAIGMLIAAGAWIFHVAAMSLAPLSIVQIVLAGGVVLLAIMAERVLGVTIGRKQWIGLGCTAAGLMMLGLTLPVAHGAHSHFSTPVLIAGPRIGAPEEHHGFMLGAAAGILFGVSDVAIKALSGLIAANGVMGLFSPALVVCVAASVAAFYASAKGLQDGDPVPVIAIPGTAANIAGVIGGIIVFGDPLSANPVALSIECFAFALVIVAAWLMPAPVHAAPAGAAA